MKYALIGCGRISVNHIKAALNNHLDIVSICDLSEEKMDGLISKYRLNINSSVVKKYTDYKKMLTDTQPDLVAICTESGFHAKIALYCINHGIHCIVEKPLAMSIDDANQIVARAKETGIKVCTCHQNRFNLAVQELRNSVDCGRFGKISHGTIHIRWNRNKEYYKQASWRGTWCDDGGALMNQCIHGIDLIRWIMNDEVEEVYGATNRRFHQYLETEDIGVAIVKFKGGAMATIEGTTNVYPQNLEETLYLFGENGTVKLGGTSANHIDVWKFADESLLDEGKEGLKEVTSNVYGNGHTSLYADMIEAVQKNRKPYVDALAGRDALELVLAIYKSQKEKKPVKLPLNSFSSLDMQGEFD